MIWQLGKTATGGIVPDYTFVLDMPVDAGMRPSKGPPIAWKTRASRSSNRLGRVF